jgi:hypothetical protein
MSSIRADLTFATATRLLQHSSDPFIANHEGADE